MLHCIEYIVRANLKVPQFLKIERYPQWFSHRVCMGDGGLLCPSRLHRPGEFENGSMDCHLDLCLRKTWTRKSCDHRDVIVSEKHHFPFKKYFPSSLKRNTGVFKFLRFEERFRIPPFPWRISLDGRPNQSPFPPLHRVFKFLRRSVNLIGSLVDFFLNKRVFLSRNFWLTAAPWKFDVYKELIS